MESLYQVMHTIRITPPPFSLWKIRYSIYLIIFCFIVTNSNSLQGQSTTLPKFLNLTTTAVVNYSGNEGFIATDNKLFRVKIYTLSEAKVGETNHWFFRLLDKDGKELNYAQIKLNGFLKNNPNVKLNHAGKIVPLGNEGKYIIKSVEVKQKGIWILKANINNLGKNDTITYEIEVNK